MVDALLDDGSTKLYVNSVSLFNWALMAQFKKIKVRGFIGKLETLDVMPVELMVESLDRKVKQKIFAFIVKQVTGGMKVINWNKHKYKWSHTKCIQFPEPLSKKYINILLVSYFHNSTNRLKKSKGKMGIQLEDLCHWAGHVLGSQLLSQFS